MEGMIGKAHLALAIVLLGIVGCRAILDFSQCKGDEDCPSGVCTVDELCLEKVEEPECEGDTCEVEEPGCKGDEDCVGVGTVCDEETKECVMAGPMLCDVDGDCEAGEICTGGRCLAGGRCDQLGGFVEQMWSDFETEGFTNVEGFREPLNGQTVVEDVEGEGANGGAVVRLSYDLREEEGITGYRMYAFPSADVRGMEELVIRARADREIDGVRVRILDTSAVRGGEGEAFATFSVEPGWREIRLPLDAFMLPDENVNSPDLQSLQLIEVLFARGNTSAEVAVVELDLVGLRGPRPVLPQEEGGDGLVWSDFEIDGFTNVEGFREPLNEGMIAHDGVDGPQGSGAMEMLYDAGAGEGLTGYRLFAFPFADVSEYSAFYMVVRSSGGVLNMGVEFIDQAELATRGTGGRASTEVSVGTGWEVIWFPLTSLVVRGTSGEPPDWASLQLINLIFREGEVCPEAGRVVISEAGFVRRSIADQ